MKISIIILFSLLLTIISFGQDTNIIKRKSFFDDTTLVHITLVDSFKNKDKMLIAKYDDATIYLSEYNVQEATKKYLLDGFTMRDSKATISFLTSNFAKSDTVQEKGRLPHSFFSRLVSEQLRMGKVKIYDRKTNSFVSSVSYRLKRVISDGYRIFYFEDNRLVYSSKEWSGILPNELMPDIE